MNEPIETYKIKPTSLRGRVLRMVGNVLQTSLPGDAAERDFRTGPDCIALTGDEVVLVNIHTNPTHNSTPFDGKALVTASCGGCKTPKAVTCLLAHPCLDKRDVGVYDVPRQLITLGRTILIPEPNRMTNDVRQMLATHFEYFD